MITIHKYKIVSKLLRTSFLRINFKIHKNYTLVEYLKIEGAKTSVGHLYHNFLIFTKSSFHKIIYKMFQLVFFNLRKLYIGARLGFHNVDSHKFENNQLSFDGFHKLVITLFSKFKKS